jgi:hypothetical protein
MISTSVAWVDGELMLLAHLAPGQDWFAKITFECGGAAETLAVVGIAAAAKRFAFLSFELWADDGTTPPMPVPEPGALLQLAGSLPLTVLLQTEELRSCHTTDAAEMRSANAAIGACIDALNQFGVVPQFRCS